MVTVYTRTKPKIIFDSKTISSRERERAEIYYDQLSDDNPLEEKPDPVSSRIEIFIDEVEFRQKDELGDVEIGSGHYIGIKPTAPYSDGAITLIVDANKDCPRVLLVSQHRHNAQGYLIEACRGFGDLVTLTMSILNILVTENGTKRLISRMKR